MRIASAIGIGIAALAVASLATIVTLRLSSGRDRNERYENDLEKLRSAVATMQQSQRTAPFLAQTLRRADEARESATTEAVVPNAANPPVTQPAPMLSPEEVEQQTRAIISTHRQLLEDSYAAEAPDAEWSRGALASLQAVYSGENFKSMILASECRATMCRVTVQYGDGPGVNWRDMLGRVPWPAASRGIFDETNRRALLYVPREGYELPEPDPASLIF
jgi:hypothetical protein